MLEVGSETEDSFRQTTLNHSVSLNNDSTISTQQSEYFHLQNISVIPMWAMGKERCNMCEFRTTFQTVLEDHIEMKHLVVEHPSTTKILQSGTVFPFSAVGGLQCSHCNFVAKYFPILAQHQQTENHGFVYISNFSLKQQKSPNPVPDNSVTSYKIKKNLTAADKENVTLKRKQKLKRSSKAYLNSIQVCITKAIDSSEKKMMTSKEIFKYCEKNFPEKLVKTKNYQNQIRHNLSLLDCFIKVSRD